MIRVINRLKKMRMSLILIPYEILLEAKTMSTLKQLWLVITIFIHNHPILIPFPAKAELLETAGYYMYFYYNGFPIDIIRITLWICNNVIFFWI
jgi:hypothetical protein